MIEAVKHKEAGRLAENVARDLAVTDQPPCNRRSRYSGLKPSNARPKWDGGTGRWVAAKEIRTPWQAFADDFALRTQREAA